EVDDVQQAEDDGQAERQQRVERPVDQADQQLPEEGRRRYAENLHSRCLRRFARNRTARGTALAPPPDRRGSGEGFRPRDQLLTSGQPPSLIGRNALSAGISARILSRSHSPLDSSGFFTSTR